MHERADVRLHVGAHGRLRCCDEADRGDAVDNSLLVGLLHVLIELPPAPLEEAAVGEECLPVTLRSTRRRPFEWIDDLGERTLQLVPFVARVPDERDTASG